MINENPHSKNHASNDYNSNSIFYSNNYQNHNHANYSSPLQNKQENIQTYIIRKDSNSVNFQTGNNSLKSKYIANQKNRSLKLIDSISTRPMNNFKNNNAYNNNLNNHGNYINYSSYLPLINNNNIKYNNFSSNNNNYTADAKEYYLRNSDQTNFNSSAINNSNVNKNLYNLYNPSTINSSQNYINGSIIHNRVPSANNININLKTNSQRFNSESKYNSKNSLNNKTNNINSYNSKANLDSSLAKNRPQSRNNLNTNMTENHKFREDKYYNNIKIYEETNKNQVKSTMCQKLIGLRNLGNTCFINTSLQCLLHCDNFISRFLDFYETNNLNHPTPISNSIYNLIMRYSKASDNSSISPEEVKNAIAYKHRIYSGFSQHDSQEFIRKLLEELSIELNTVSEKKPYKILNEKNEQKNKKELNIEYDRIFRERENSIIIDTFYGQTISIFQCLECNYESFSFEKFLDIPLILGESFNDQDLSKLLVKFFEGEIIQWESPCSNITCKKKSMHKKNPRISILPDVLIFSLQRYNNRIGRKNNCRVSFKEEIDVRDLTDSVCILG